MLTQLAQRLEGGRSLGGPVQVFAVCFSGEGDELSQRRGYACGTVGYAIGFAEHTLDHFTFALPVGQEPLGPINGEPPSLRKGPQRMLYTEVAAVREPDSLVEQVGAGSPTAKFGPKSGHSGRPSQRRRGTSTMVSRRSVSGE